MRWPRPANLSAPQETSVGQNPHLDRGALSGQKKRVAEKNLQAGLEPGGAGSHFSDSLSDAATLVLAGLARGGAPGRPGGNSDAEGLQPSAGGYGRIFFCAPAFFTRHPFLFGARDESCQGHAYRRQRSIGGF